MFSRNQYSRNEYCGHVATQSGGDTDTLITTTVADIANWKLTVIIGKDIDLLILLIHFVNKKGTK